jgi:ATP-dependent helicase/nuclease subunit A
LTAQTSDFERTRRAQREAADPRASAWVSANAGTGKTHVLTLRALRLMLAGTVPERILALTYTKAAAAEMSKRVYETLAQWVTMEEGKLATELMDLTTKKPQPEEIDRARTLFTTAIETPGGLKVQTIHSFCERLLQRFPLEADVAPGFAILDEPTANTLQREAIDAVLATATRNKSSPEGKALLTAIRYAADERFDELLREALRLRTRIEQVMRMGAGEEDDALAALEVALRSSLKVRAPATEEGLTAELAAVLHEGDMRRLRDALATGGKADIALSQSLGAAISARSPRARAAAIERFFCTEKAAPRARLLSNSLKAEHPDLDSLATQAQARAVFLVHELKGLYVVNATIALYQLAGAVLQHYTAAKARRAALDYDDLIGKTVNLLSTKDSTAWVLYKLDRGIDHILVDEAQDTSTEQWQVVEALANEFFTGLGQRDGVRTLFAVGDEKQSIYSFQGAAPRKFAEMGQLFAALAEAAAQTWRRIPLDLSFRTVAPILSAVDGVFGDHDHTPGLTAERTEIRHAVHRTGHGGLVEIWPVMAPEGGTPADAWSPLEEEAPRAPEVRLAERIAATIRHWLDSGERLVSEDRPIRPGDILILLRKRKPFAAPMVAALKARRIDVAGADRLRLSDQIAVEDLISLGDFLTLPEDDLALAEVLKSPLFGFDDNDLLALAATRKGTLWSSLIAHADANPRYRAAAETLKRWRSRADYAPPFEFFASILDREGARAKFLARLGPEAADPLDEFLNLALAYDDRAPPSLTGFLAHLRETDAEVKRDMEHGRNEVRVMTVHGAKGLEAPIVFLPDTCSIASGTPSSLLELADVPLPEGVAAPFVWRVKGTSSHGTVTGASQARAALEAEERHRLLYVAMTRARDRLYVAGFEGKRGRPDKCWYNLVFEALKSTLTDATAHDGGKVWRRIETQSADAKAGKGSLPDESVPAPLPPWATRPAPREPTIAIPLAPSRLEAYAPDDQGEPLTSPTPSRERREPSVVSPTLGEDGRFLRGTLTHALLQYLPGLPQKGWSQAAKSFIERRGAALSSKAREGIVKETVAILTAPEFAPLFGPQSRSEVPVVAMLPNPKPKGAPLRLVGQIDRLVDLGKEVLIVDYKTNRPPPKRVEAVAPAYLLQLAAYRLALAEIYPGRTVRAALLWTEGPRIMQVPGEVLDHYSLQLYELDFSRLDAGEGHS